MGKVVRFNAGDWFLCVVALAAIVLVLLAIIFEPSTSPAKKMQQLGYIQAIYNGETVWVRPVDAGTLYVVETP